jgi:hypothetical protein
MALKSALVTANLHPRFCCASSWSLLSGMFGGGDFLWLRLFSYLD